VRTVALCTIKGVVGKAAAAVLLFVSMVDRRKWMHNTSC
jgi:hypothetical protein